MLGWREPVKQKPSSLMRLSEPVSRERKNLCTSSPSTTKVTFLESMPGVFFTLHWYVAVSETLRVEKVIVASPRLGSPTNFMRLIRSGFPS